MYVWLYEYAYGICIWYVYIYISKYCKSLQTSWTTLDTLRHGQNSMRLISFELCQLHECPAPLGSTDEHGNNKPNKPMKRTLNEL